MTKNIFYIGVIIAVILAFSGSVFAIEKNKTGFTHKHFAGGRIGAYTSNAAEDPLQAETVLDFTKSSVYAEFFYAHRLFEPLSVEFSVGLYSRGDVQYEDNVETSPVKLYPIWLSAKIYPLYKLQLPLHFFVQPGAGMFYGVHETYDYSRLIYEQKNRVLFTYMLGAGADFPLGRSFGLTASFKFIAAEFNKPLAEVKDYSGWTLAVGAGYIFGK